MGGFVIAVEWVGGFVIVVSVIRSKQGVDNYTMLPALKAIGLGNNISLFLDSDSCEMDSSHTRDTASSSVRVYKYNPHKS